MKASRTLENRLRAQVRGILGQRPHSRQPVYLPESRRRYEILREIGRGTRGIVYLARTRRPNRQVAIKILRSPDPESRQRFWREAQCASCLKHDNIVAIYDTVRTRDADAIVMEYVRGKTIDQVIPRSGLPIRRWRSLAIPIARAVAAIHSLGMMHRDLKPRNIMVGRTGIVKVLDFGLAKIIGAANPPMTVVGTIQGTVGYMSPEQVLGESADRRSDIFSLGAVLYEMLAGLPAFQESSYKSTLDAILCKTPTFPARVPRQIARIVRRCLAKDPNLRYQTGMELAADLERIGVPVHR